MLAAVIAPKLKLPAFVTVRMPIVSELDKDAMALFVFKRVTLPAPAITRLCAPLLITPDKVRLFPFGALIIAVPVNEIAFEMVTLALACSVVLAERATLPLPRAELFPTARMPLDTMVPPL